MLPYIYNIFTITFCLRQVPHPTHSLVSSPPVTLSSTCFYHSLSRPPSLLSLSTNTTQLSYHSLLIGLPVSPAPCSSTVYSKHSSQRVTQVRPHRFCSKSASSSHLRTQDKVLTITSKILLDFDPCYFSGLISFSPSLCSNQPDLLGVPRHTQHARPPCFCNAVLFVKMLFPQITYFVCVTSTIHAHSN